MNIKNPKYLLITAWCLFICSLIVPTKHYGSLEWFAGLKLGTFGLFFIFFIPQKVFSGNIDNISSYIIMISPLSNISFFLSPFLFRICRNNKAIVRRVMFHAFSIIALIITLQFILTNDLEEIIFIQIWGASFFFASLAIEIQSIQNLTNSTNRFNKTGS